MYFVHARPFVSALPLGISIVASRSVPRPVLIASAASGRCCREPRCGWQGRIPFLSPASPSAPKFQRRCSSSFWANSGSSSSRGGGSSAREVRRYFHHLMAPFWPTHRPDPVHHSWFMASRAYGAMECSKPKCLVMPNSGLSSIEHGWHAQRIALHPI